VREGDGESSVIKRREGKRVEWDLNERENKDEIFLWQCSWSIV
jgi:hypothetical protein